MERNSSPQPGRWRVYLGMAIGALIGFLLSRRLFPEAEHQASPLRPNEVHISRFEEPSESLAPMSGYMFAEDEPLDDLAAIHAVAIETGTEDGTIVETEGIPAPIDAAAPDTLPKPREATSIDVINQDAENSLRALIDKELGSLGESDRRVWFDVLRGMSEQEAREIIGLWMLTGGTERFPKAMAPAGPVPTPAAEKPTEETIGPGSTVTSTDNSPQRRALQAALAKNLAGISLPGFCRHDLSTACDPDEAPLDLTRGRSVQTSNPLHCLISGSAFFRLRRGEVTCCTRCGTFDLSESGELLQRHGGELWSLDPRVRVPLTAASIRITNEGDVLACDAASGELKSCGRITLVSCLNPQRLNVLRGSLLMATTGSGPLVETPTASYAVQDISLSQGFLELSNATLAGEQRLLEEFDARTSLLKQLTPATATAPATAR